MGWGLSPTHCSLIPWGGKVEVKVKFESIELGFDLFPKRPEGEDPIRTKGLHLTDIIQDIMVESGMKKTASGAMWQPDQLNMAGEVGFMWEELLSQVMKNRLPCRMGEVEEDGVIMSPDGVEIDDDGPLLSEYKAVWASSSRSPVDNWKWMTQVKAYCRALGVLRVKMYILYLNGNWRGSGPEYRGSMIEFTPSELQENWELITNHAKHKGWLPK